MANSPQARKRARQSETRRQSNISQKSATRTAIKKVLKHILDGDKQAATVAMTAAQSSLDRLAGKRIIHPNKAARLKKRLNKKLKTLVLSA